MSVSVSQRSRSTATHAAAPDRWLVTLTGLLVIGAGALVLLVGLGVFGEFRAQRPLLDPLAVDAVRSHPTAARAVAVALGLLVTVLAGLWALRAFRPERRPALDDARVGAGSGDPSGAGTRRSRGDVRSAAAAIAADAEALPGVDRASARLVSTRDEPALRLTLALAADADVQAIWRDLNAVLSGAARVLGVESLPAVVRLKLSNIASP